MMWPRRFFHNRCKIDRRKKSYAKCGYVAPLRCWVIGEKPHGVQNDLPAPTKAKVINHVGAMHFQLGTVKIIWTLRDECCSDLLKGVAIVHPCPFVALTSTYRTTPAGIPITNVLSAERRADRFRSRRSGPDGQYHLWRRVHSDSVVWNRHLQRHRRPGNMPGFIADKQKTPD